MRTTKQRHLTRKPLMLSFLWLMSFCMVTTAELKELELIPGTIKNFVEYYQESIADIKEQGGETAFSYPQADYSPGFGPLSIFPEVIGDVFSSPIFRSFYLFDVPTIPFELRFNRSTPEIPAINRTVVGVTEQDGFSKPHIPPLRWSEDGRQASNHKWAVL